MISSQVQLAGTRSKDYSIISLTTLAGLCGSDMHTYRGHSIPKDPFTMGHEFVGEIVSVGQDFEKDHSQLAVGDFVVAPFTSRHVSLDLICTPALFCFCGTLNGMHIPSCREYRTNLHEPRLLFMNRRFVKLIHHLLGLAGSVAYTAATNLRPIS